MSFINCCQNHLPRISDCNISLPSQQIRLDVHHELQMQYTQPKVYTSPQIPPPKPVAAVVFFISANQDSIHPVTWVNSESLILTFHVEQNSTDFTFKFPLASDHAQELHCQFFSPGYHHLLPGCFQLPKWFPCFHLHFSIVYLLLKMEISHSNANHIQGPCCSKT